MLAVVGCNNIGDSLTGPLLPSAQRTAFKPTEVDGQTWTAWRGGMNHGVSSTASVPLKFSRDENIAWMTPIAGTGNSSPIVTADHIFLSSVVGEAHRMQLQIVALDRATGAVAWKAELGRPIGTTHGRNGHASATLASDGQFVFAYFGAKGLFCYTVDGERRWHRPFPNQSHEWGAASSPVLAGGMVIQLIDSQTDSFLAAYDVSTGDVVWQTPRSSNGCWTTPVVTQVNDQWQIIVNGSGSSDGTPGRISGYELTTGKPLWEIAGTRDIVCPTAIVGGGLIVSTSGSNGPIIALESQVTHRTAPSLQPPIRWQLPIGGAYVPTGVIYQEHLYLVDDDGLLRCLNLVDGHQLWRERLGTPVSASLIAAAADKFELLAKNKLHERCLATPAIAGSEIYIRGEQHLFCIADTAAESAIQSPSDLSALEVTTPLR